jgi:hypothetical protein
MGKNDFVYAGLGAKGVEIYVRRCGCRVLRWKMKLEDMTVEYLEARTCEGRILRPRVSDPRWPHDLGRWAQDWTVVR